MARAQHRWAGGRILKRQVLNRQRQDDDRRAKRPGRVRHGQGRLEAGSRYPGVNGGGTPVSGARRAR
jgi:hypothetical protein